MILWNVLHVENHMWNNLIKEQQDNQRSFKP